MGDKHVQFSEDVLLGPPEATKANESPTRPTHLSQFKSLSDVAKTIDQRRLASPSSPSPSTPTKQKINIVFVVDLESKSLTYHHRQSILDCVRAVCREMQANLVLVQYDELYSNSPTALDSFYDADAAILDVSIEEQRNSLFYHLGVRESFSMKQNILVVANLMDSHQVSAVHRFEVEGEESNKPLLTHEDASKIKSLLPNYPLFVYSIRPRQDCDKVATDNDGDKRLPTRSESSTNLSYECFVSQRFIDLTYSPGSDEQMDPSLPDFDEPITPLSDTGQQPNLRTDDSKLLNDDDDEGEASVNLKGQLKEALKNVKWQAKAHMKDKFLADLKKARESYQGQELYKVLHVFRRRLDDPNMLSIDIVNQMLVSFQEVQDYDSMVKLVDDLSKFPALTKITSSPQIVFHHAFALNRRHNVGDSDRALELITNALDSREHQIPDSICLCGRIFKDRFIESSYEDKESLKSAIDWYRKGFKISPNEYAAINLATLLYIAGHDFNSSEELKHVGLVLNNLIGKKGPVHKLNNYWDVATYFEFCLLANQFAKAIEAASCMFNLKPNKWHLKSTIGNIRLIYRFKPKTSAEQSKYSSGGFTNSTTTANTQQHQQLQEVVQSPEEQIVEFWMDFFIDAVLDSCENQIRFAALVLEQSSEYVPTYITMNLDAEEKSITISQMCITHLRDLNGCRKPHLWHIKATGVRGISLYKRDERCVFLYVHDNSDDFQIFFPSESIRARFRALVLSITGNRSIDISANLKDTERKINFVYELDKDDNRIVLGRGSKGVVYAARDVDTQTQIAIKEVPVKNIGEVQPLHEEIRLHSMLRHRNIVQYLGTSHEGNYFRIIMERVPGGSLSQLLQREWGPLNENVIAYYARQILDGLQYLHRQKIVHRDIKGDNVLVNTYTGILKISDFGTCKRLAAINPNTETFAGTVPFMAPELMDRGQRGYSMPADIWSFGCTIVEMASGKPPFIEIGSGAQVMFRVGFYKEHPEIPNELSEKCKQFILRCFEPNTEHRATCDDLLLDAFLDEARPLSSASSNLFRNDTPEIRDSHQTTTPPIDANQYERTFFKSPRTTTDQSQRVVATNSSLTPPIQTSRVNVQQQQQQRHESKDTPANIYDLKEEEVDIVDEDDDDLFDLDDADDDDLSDDMTLKANANEFETMCNTLDEFQLENISASVASMREKNDDQLKMMNLNGKQGQRQSTRKALVELVEKTSDPAADRSMSVLFTETLDGTKQSSPDQREDATSAVRVATTIGSGNSTIRKQTTTTTTRQKIINVDEIKKSTKQLFSENRKLWKMLHHTQMELNELLRMQLDDKQVQIESLKRLSSGKSINASDELEQIEQAK